MHAVIVEADRSQWTVSEGNNDGKMDQIQHKTHLQHTNYNKVVPLGTDYEGSWMFRAHIYKYKLTGI